MTLETPLLRLGDWPLRLVDVLMGCAVLGLVLLLAMALSMWRNAEARRQDREDTQRRSAEMEYRLAELSGALQSMAAQAQGNTVHLQRTLDERLDMVSQRVGVGLSEQATRTAHSISQLNERLAVIDAAQQNITALSSEMVSLKDILANKQARGAFGQGRMEAIIRDGLHSKAYVFQATLSNGTRPDCLINLPDSRLKLVVDAKFPLEAISALKAAADDAARKAAEARLRTDIGKHVKDIAEKYLLPGETHDTAIMFVPSESIYADLHEQFEDVVQKAHRARVLLASPNVLMLLVQTLQAMVKDVAMRDQAHLIKQEVAKLLEDVARLQERTIDLKRHFDMANADLEKIGTSAKNIARRGSRIETLDLPEQAEADAGKLPPAEGQRPRLITST